MALSREATLRKFVKFSAFLLVAPLAVFYVTQNYGIERILRLHAKLGFLVEVPRLISVQTSISVCVE